MTKKLSAIDRQRVSNALTKCAAATKDIESNEELADKAYQILSKELGDNPGLFKAACQVYNSCKSIHKLAAANDDNRGNSFSILNVQDMSSRLNAEKVASIRKAASAPAVFRKFERPIENEPIRKTASATCKVRVAPEINAEAAEIDYPSFLIEELKDAESLLYKSANAVKHAATKRSVAFEEFTAALATEPKELRKDAAARLLANYGDSVHTLIEEFSAARPMQKLASGDYSGKYRGTPALPSSHIAKSAKKFLDADVELEARTKLHQEVLEKTASMVLDHCRNYYGLGKNAAGDGSLASLVVKSQALKELAEFFGDDAEEIDQAKKIFNTQFINNMLAHSHRRSFMRAAMNDALSKYPLSQLVPAYNKAVATLPPTTRLTPATANQALIESLMAKDLATGTVPSKADIELISTLANSIGKYRAEDGVIQGAAVK